MGQAKQQQAFDPSLPERQHEVHLLERAVERITTLLVVVILAVASLLPPFVAPGWAQDVISQEEPQPESVDQDQTAIDRLFLLKPEIPRARPFPWLREQLKDLTPFLRDTKLTLSPRTFYLYRDKFDDSVSEAWTVGGALSYQSGWLFDHVAVGAVAYLSQSLYAPLDHDGTTLLEPRQESYGVLGQSYARVRLIEEHYLNIGRYAYDTPYVNRNDNRMTPNTFEGYTAQGILGKDDGPQLKYLGGYIAKIKPRNDDEFLPMSQVAGASVNHGVTMGGALFTTPLPIGKLSAGAAEYFSDDVINIVYGESKYTADVTKDLGVLLALQFTDQRSTGRDLLTGSAFNTNEFGIKSEVSYRHAVFTFGYTTARSGADLRSPWSGFPGYTSVQVGDFNRAGEDAVIAKLAYEFSRIGAPGVSAYALIVHGWGRVNPSTHASVDNENEMNLDLQWRPKLPFLQSISLPFLEGISLRARYAHVWQYQGSENTIDDFRAIINYDLNLL